MLDSSEGYKKKIKEIANLADKTEPKDFGMRYIYRQKKKNKDGKELIFYITKDIVMSGGGKEKLLEKLRAMLKDTSEEEKNVKLNYKFEQQITEGNVAILNDEDFPDELKRLIVELSEPADNAKNERGNKRKKSNNGIVGYAVSFKGVILVKKIGTVALATGNKFRNAILIGSKSNEIKKFEEDIIILTVSEPDFIVFSQDGNDPVFIFNSNHFSSVCLSRTAMKERLKHPSSPINNILDEPKLLHDYLEKATAAVHVVYFNINKENFRIDSNYITKLNDQFFANKKLQIDNKNRLKCKNLTGKDIYLILVGKYGSRVKTDGTIENIIVDQYEKIQN